MHGLQWLFLGILLHSARLKYFVNGRSLRKSGPSMLLHRLINEYRKMKRYEAENNLPQKRMDSLLQAIIEKDDRSPRLSTNNAVKKMTIEGIYPTAPIILQSPFIPQVPITPQSSITSQTSIIPQAQPISAVESITFPAQDWNNVVTLPQTNFAGFQKMPTTQLHTYVQFPSASSKLNDDKSSVFTNYLIKEGLIADNSQEAEGSKKTLKKDDSFTDQTSEKVSSNKTSERIESVSEKPPRRSVAASKAKKKEVMIVSKKTRKEEDKLVTNQASKNDLSIAATKKADKDSDNPHPHVLHFINQFSSVYSQAHEGNSTDDEESYASESSKLRAFNADRKMNPNPRPDPKSSEDPVNVLTQITNELDKGGSKVVKKPVAKAPKEEKHDKPKGHEKTESQKPSGVDYKPDKPTAHSMKERNNSSSSSSKHNTKTNKKKKPRYFVKNNNIKSVTHLRKKLFDPDNWDDRRTHALALLAKIESDIDQPDVVENVIRALGVDDIMKLDQPAVEHDDVSGLADFGSDRDWVDEELAESSGKEELPDSEGDKENKIMKVNLVTREHDSKREKHIQERNPQAKHSIEHQRIISD